MLRFLALALLAALAAPHTASALESAAATSPHGSATLVSEADSFKPGQPLRLGLHLHIAPGWHTYWLNPGDAGAPPTIDITGATAGPIAYPTPQREQDGPFTSFVYLNEVTLPFTVTPPPGAAGPLHLTAHATWLVCEKICVPEEASFALALPPGNAAPGANAGLFRDADAATPRPSPFPAQVAADGTLRLEAPGVRPVSLYVFPDEAGVIDQALPQSFTTDAGGLSVHLKPLAKTGFTKPFAGVMTLTDQAGRTEALHVAATPTTALPAGGTAAPAMPHLADALLLAFLGGLVLNLMPCVLPVLAMKALAMARLSGAARGRIRHESLLYTAGVLVAFGAIGGITLAVGAAGGAAGWGVQFQSAAFSAGMALLMLAVALNFSGVYEFGAGAAGFGQSLAQRGSFFTGLLAVVVATPCTAPFMATALAAAVALPPAAGMAIFLALGLGLAAPYAALAIFPGMARLLPRPGAWMERLRHVLALPMYAAAAFLAWVVWHAAGDTGLFAVLGAGALLALAAIAYGRHQQGRAPAALRAGGIGALAVAALIITALATHAPAAPPMALVHGAEPFTQARLDTLRAAHRPVLVDMSAAWCITCLVNERVALSPAAVQSAFAQHNVAYLVGDWTRQDPAITRFLQAYGRNGVPLYVYFPAQGAPLVLPQILTQASVLAQIGA